MQKEFIIDQVSWHTDTPGNPESREHIEHRFRSIVNFLQSNGLVCQQLLGEGEIVGDSFCIRSTDLTNEGFEVMRQSYDRWLRAVDKGQDPSDVRILERTLAKIRKRG